MKHSFNTILVLFLVVIGISCNTSKKDKIDSHTGRKIIIQKPFYSIDTANVSLLWTAYKFSNKIGVSGTFNEFNLQLRTYSGSIDELLNNAQITINTHSVDTGNNLRDPKLRTYFFEVFKADTILGEVIDASNGNAAIVLKMNKLTNDTSFKYSIKDDTLQLSTHLDLLLWNGKDALKLLNKECYDLHTGTDGISKLWPDVDVVLKMPIKTHTSKQ